MEYSVIKKNELLVIATAWMNFRRRLRKVKKPDIEAT